VRRNGSGERHDSRSHSASVSKGLQALLPRMMPLDHLYANVDFFAMNEQNYARQRD